MSRMSVTVVGAGLSGLATAWYLADAGADVRVIEAASGPGGLIQTTAAPEGLIETAARAFTWTERTAALFAAAGVQPIYAREESKRRYIFRDGQPRRWPLTPGETIGAAARFGRAWAGRHVRPHDDESVAEWGTRVLGPSATTWLIAPALQGIYASPPDELSARALFGKKRPRRGKLMAPANGMGELMAGLHDRLVARGVAFEFDRHAAAADLDASDAAVVCTSAPAAAHLLEPCAPVLARAIRKIRMVSIVIVTAFFPPHADDLRGFGVLFPRSSGIRALGALFNAEIFEGRSRLRSETWIYGDLNPSALPIERDASACVVEDRQRLTRRSDAPIVVYAKTHRNALPVYDRAVLDAQAALSSLPPRLAAAGNYLGQLGVSALVDSAAATASHLDRYGLSTHADRGVPAA